jgi:hypothetical protein
MTHTRVLIALIGVAIGMFCLGFLFRAAISDEIVRSNDCNTAFLRVDQPYRNAIPEDEVRRICGNDPHFNFTPHP